MRVSPRSYPRAVVEGEEEEEEEEKEEEEEIQRRSSACSQYPSTMYAWG